MKHHTKSDVTRCPECKAPVVGVDQLLIEVKVVDCCAACEARAKLQPVNVQEALNLLTWVGREHLETASATLMAGWLLVDVLGQNEPRPSRMLTRHASRIAGKARECHAAAQRLAALIGAAQNLPAA